MKVNLIFADGRELVETFPLTTPVSFLGELIRSDQGIISAEIIGVTHDEGTVA